MAQVKLILLDDIEDLGLAGEEVHVAPGYARNYLLPRGLAAKATPATLRLIASRKEKIEERRQTELAQAQTMADKLAALELSIAMQATADEQLFGSVTPRAIAEKLAENGIEIDHVRIKIEEPIRRLGQFTVQVKLHATLTAPLNVWVVRS